MILSPVNRERITPTEHNSREPPLRAPQVLMEGGLHVQHVRVPTQSDILTARVVSPVQALYALWRGAGLFRYLFILF